MTIENFNQFYDEYQRFSAYVAYCITKDKLLAEDISQEIFITFYKMKENLDYSDRKKLKALVLRATTNRCNDYFRKSSTKQEMCTFDEEGVEETPDEKGDPEAQLLRMEEETYQRLVLRKLRMRNPQNYDILIKHILRSEKRYDGWNPSVYLQTLLLRKNDGCHTADGSYPEVSHQ